MAFFYEALPGNECHRKCIVKDTELHVSSCRSLVTLSCRLSSLVWEAIVRKQMGVVINKVLRGLYM